MCQIKNKKLKIAKKDIICYKILINNNGTFESPIWKFRWIFMKRYYTPIKVEQQGGFPAITEGFHAFCRLKDVIELKSDKYTESCYVIGKMLIPVGSIYIKGKAFNHLISSIVSNHMKLLDIIQI